LKKAYFNWSTGKDSTLALYKILQSQEFSIDTLVTTINSDFDRVSMHGLRKDLLFAQVNSLQIPLETIAFSKDVTMEVYTKTMESAMKSLVEENYTHAVFGDIFLEDLKNYRDNNLAKVGVEGVYPIWKRDTKDLLKEFLDLGFKTVIVCANSKYFDKGFVGTIIDKNFINNLPKNVDPCGENGEFHTFCFDGPIFKKPIDFEIGEKIYREYNTPKTDDDSVCQSNSETYGVWYCDLIPGK
jgi:uncharacterized protein (TIGR00290 family)